MTATVPSTTSRTANAATPRGPLERVAALAASTAPGTALGPAVADLAAEVAGGGALLLGAMPDGHWSVVAAGGPGPLPVPGGRLLASTTVHPDLPAAPPDLPAPARWHAVPAACGAVAGLLGVVGGDPEAPAGALLPLLLPIASRVLAGHGPQPGGPGRATVAGDALQRVIDALPDPIAIKDLDGRVVRVNWSSAWTLGLSQMPGRSMAELLPSHLADRFEIEDRYVARTGRPLTRDPFEVSVHGTRRTYLRTSAPLRDGSGAVEGVISVWHDITELRASEAAVSRALAVAEEANAQLAATVSELERTSHDLATERDVLQALLNTVPDPIYVRDRERRYVRANWATATLLGAQGPEATIGTRIDDWMPGPVADRSRQEDEEILRSGEQVVNHPFTMDDGSGRSLLVTKVPLVDRSGAVVGLVGIDRDVTTLTEAERTLAAERDQLQAWIDNLEELIYFKDLGSRYVRLNRAMAQTLGLSACETAIGRTDLDFFPEPLAREFMADEAWVMETGQPLVNKIERHVVDPRNARWFITTKVPLRDARGAVVGVVGNTREITDVRRVQDALGAERDLLQAVLDTVPDPIYIKDPESRYLRVNQTLAALIGVDDPTAVAGMTPSDFFPPEAADSMVAMERAVMASREPRLNEMRPIEVDGETRWFLDTQAPIVDAAGEVRGLVGIARDITDLKRAQQDLADALRKQTTLNDELERLSRAKSGFISILSHEFRTPLTSIQGFSELLRDAALSPEEMHEFADDIHNSAVRLARLVSDILDLDRMEAERFVLNPAEVAVNPLVTEVVDSFRGAAIGHEFRLDLDPSLPTILADSDRLYQVLTNIVGNAIKYSPRGGEVLVRTERDHDGVLVSVRDRGVGIPPEAVDLIFDPYVRLAAGEQRRVAGTGLGLSITRELVELHGGRIWAESRVGSGSTFHVWLPLPSADGRAAGTA